MRLRRARWPKREDVSRGPDTPEPGFAFSPGGWSAPKGSLSAWNWLPPSGAAPRVDLMPTWVRAWYRTPLIDRYAYAWMWRRGGWEVKPPAATGGEGQAGVRERLRPLTPQTPPRVIPTESVD
jgi:hypothetical protein